MQSYDADLPFYLTDARRLDPLFLLAASPDAARRR